MRSKGWKLIGLLLVLSLIAAACASDSADDTEAPDATEAPSGGDDAPADTEAPDAGLEGTITVLVHQNPPMVEYMEEFNAMFTEATGVEVDMSVVGAGDLSTVTQTRLTANDIDVIDIFGFANPVQDYMTGANPPNWQTLIDAGLLMELSGEDFVGNYDQASIDDACTYNGGVYCVNLGRVSYSGMFVNDTLLAEVGVETPTTWEELVSSCDAVKGAGYKCMVVGGADGWPIFVGAYGLFGSLYPDQAAFVEGLWTGTATWDDAAGIEYFNRLQTYASEMLDPEVTGLGHDAAPARYLAGDIAFMPTGVWQGPAVDEATFDWTYIPFPGSSNAADNQFLFGKYDQGWAVAEGSTNKDAALAYVSMFSEPDVYQGFVDATGFLPTQPTAVLNSQLGEDVADLMSTFRVGFEQYWVAPTGAGQYSNGSVAASLFAPFNEFTDAAELAALTQADLAAGLGG